MYPSLTILVAKKPPELEIILVILVYVAIMLKALTTIEYDRVADTKFSGHIITKCQGTINVATSTRKLICKLQINLGRGNYC